MNRRNYIAVCVCVLLTLCGCQLAKPDAGSGESRDRLIGVYVTREFIDLFDFESFAQDNAHLFTSGDEVVIEDTSNKYNGRLYAKHTVIPRTDGETGHTYEEDKYEFEGVDGVAFMLLIKPSLTGDYNDSYISTYGDEGISDTKLYSFSGDNKQEYKIECTVYYELSNSDAEIEDTMAVFNPVYQDSDGNVYLMSGNSFSTSGVLGEGFPYSSSMGETYTSSDNGIVNTEESIEVKVNIAVSYAPSKVAITQMSADNIILGREEYDPRKVPDEITPMPGTEYIILERYTINYERESIIDRKIVNSGEPVTVRYARNDGICISKDVNVNWD